MAITIKELIEKELIRRCKEVTKLYWKTPEKKEFKPNMAVEDFEMLSEVFKKATHIDGRYKRFQADILAIMFKCPEISHIPANAEADGVIFAKLVVIKVKSNNNYDNSKYRIGDLYICYDSQKAFEKNGQIGYSFSISNTDFIAADESEVTKCVKNLTKDQFNKIRVSFPEIEDAALNKVVEVKVKNTSEIKKVEKVS